jgi:hypothetical protein
MNIHSAPTIFAAITTLFIGVFVYLKNKEAEVNKTFVLFMLCMAFYNINIFGIRTAPDGEWAELWGKIFRTGLLFLPATFLHFVIAFTYTIKSISKRYLTLLKLSYALNQLLGRFHLVASHSIFVTSCRL